MTAPQKFDIIVIGSGPGGYPAAIRAASRGKKVALVESGDVGGTCLNRGCIPSKALIAGAAILDQIRHAEVFGIKVGPITFDYEKMIARKDQVVSRLRKSLEGLIKANGVQLIRGTARFLSTREIKIEGATPQTIQAEKIIIATGSEPRAIPAFPFDGEKILDSTALLNLKTLPKKIVIIGGGIIGCEFASLYSLLGVEVALIEMLPSILPAETASVSSTLSKALQKRGVDIHTSVKVETVEKTPSSVSVKLATGQEIKGDIALVAVGRLMNLEGLGLEKLGIKLVNPSQVAVNEKMETNVPGIYAVGDIASKWWLAHVATHQGLVAADNASGFPAVMHYEAVPNVIFTHPEIATVGMSPEQAKEQGIESVIGNFPLQALGKAQASEQMEGFAQIVIDSTTGQILGAQIVSHEASSLIGEMALAIQNELTIECIHNTIHAHPTLAEAWAESALMAIGIPLHFPPKSRP